MVTIETTLITLNLSAWQDLGGEPWFCRPCGPSLGRNRPKGVQPPRRMWFGTSRVCRQKDQVSQAGHLALLSFWLLGPDHGEIVAGTRLMMHAKLRHSTLGLPLTALGPPQPMSSMQLHSQRDRNRAGRHARGRECVRTSTERRWHLASIEG